MIEDQIIDKIEEAASKLETASLAAQREMMKRVEALVRSLEFDSEGLVKNSAKNVQAISRLYNELRKVFAKGGWPESVDKFGDEIGDIADYWDVYFTELIGTSYNPDRLLYNRLWSETVAATTQTLAGVGVQEVVGREAQKILRANVFGKASARQIEEALREFIAGSAEREGKLRRYVAQVARDAASQFSRNYTQAVSETLGLTHWKYSGGTVKDTRDFCRRRVGGYYTSDEVESWASLDWQGKIPETNATTIFSYLGGYNCMHILRPVSKQRYDKEKG